jgi:hypothetical protein
VEIRDRIDFEIALEGSLDVIFVCPRPVLDTTLFENFDWSELLVVLLLQNLPGLWIRAC